MKKIKWLAGPLLLAGTLSVFVGVCGVIVADRKYVRKAPEMQQEVLNFSSALQTFGFASVFVTLPLCCYTPRKRNV